MLNHSIPAAGRGEVGLMPCPQCGDHHRSVYRLGTLPVLLCPAIPTPGEMRLRQVVKGPRGGMEFVVVVGPEHEPVVEEKPKRRTA